MCEKLKFHFFLSVKTTLISQDKSVFTAQFKTKFIQKFQQYIYCPMLENYPMSYTDSILVKKATLKEHSSSIENLMVNLCRRFIKYRYESKA